VFPAPAVFSRSTLTLYPFVRRQSSSSAAATRAIPVLIVTAKGERTDRLLGVESAPYHYLTKPFQLDELLAKIQEVLATSRAT